MPNPLFVQLIVTGGLLENIGDLDVRFYHDLASFRTGVVCVKG